MFNLIISLCRIEDGFFVYLYCSEVSVDDVLILFLFKKIRIFKKKYNFSKYFFIRYNDEYGDHVRLRMFVEGKKIERIIKPNIENEYIDFLKRFLGVKYSNFNNIIRYTDYEPEVERYGGDKCISIAEDYFYLSSQTQADLAKIYDFKNYSSKILLILQLQLLALYSWSNDKEILKGILLNIINDWIFATLKKVGSFTNLRSLCNSEDGKYCIELFSKSYNRDSDSIIAALRMVSDDIQYNRLKINNVYNKWFVNNKIILEKLCMLEINQKKLFKEKMDSPKEFLNLSIFKSLIHMNNNRIGIDNSEESYIAYILFRFIDQDL
ncbi:thiopeptide-type bacteriocin biosynthesis protein [Pedobacter sp. NJ-S-72]